MATLTSTRDSGLDFLEEEEKVRGRWMNKAERRTSAMERGLQSCRDGTES
jgi:hypothetical protein